MSECEWSVCDGKVAPGKQGASNDEKGVARIGRELSPEQERGMSVHDCFAT